MKQEDESRIARHGGNMKSFLEHVRYKIQAFMQGRYGMDELSYFLSMTGLTLFLLSVLIRPLSILYFPALAVLIWSWFRSFSKNIYKRREERNAYLEFRSRAERNRTAFQYDAASSDRGSACACAGDPGSAGTEVYGCGQYPFRYDKHIPE